MGNYLIVSYENNSIWVTTKEKFDNFTNSVNSIKGKVGIQCDITKLLFTFNNPSEFLNDLTVIPISPSTYIELKESVGEQIGFLNFLTIFSIHYEL